MTPKRRKGVPNSFPCEYPDCFKSFSRAEHLARHKLNHNPLVIYKCSWNGCTRTFVRADLRDRHLKRHTARALKTKEHLDAQEVVESASYKGSSGYSKSSEGSQKPLFGVLDLGNKKPDQLLQPRLDSMAIGSIILPNLPPYSVPDVDIQNLDGASKQLSDLVNEPAAASFAMWLDAGLESAWGAPKDGAFFLGLPTNTYIDDILQLTLPEEEAANAIQDHALTPEAMTHILNALPGVTSCSDANIPAFQRCLQIYWRLFHAQFPFLHRPSFVASEAPPLLVLLMVTLGAGLVHSTGEDELAFFADPQSLADAIGVPLRWKLFELGDWGGLPVKLWVMQLLVILEYYEKYLLTRYMHERTFIHHGALIQLLRRLPTLGGNPTRLDHQYNPDVFEEDYKNQPPEQRREILWKNWIEYESLKRTTLMAFYVDATHFIIFGHLGILNAHQIQLELPCDDALWEAQPGHKFLEDLKPQPFLQALKGALKKDKFIASVFGKRIVMAGLLAVISQLLQRDLQISALAFGEGKQGTWKEYLGYILDHFIHDSMKGCCDTASSVIEPLGESSGELSINKGNSVRLYFHTNDPRCKFSTYHAAHIVMKIAHYDLVLYSGAPWRVGVYPRKEDYDIVKKRMEAWASSISGRVSVIHAFLFMFEMLLPPENYPDSEVTEFPYDCSSDPMIERTYVMYIATLAIWSYCFTASGAECQVLSQINPEEYPETEKLPQKEEGYAFLRRIRRELSIRSGTSIHTSPPKDAKTFHRSVLLQAKILPEISNKQNVIGFLRLMTKSLGGSNWQLSKEFPFLFNHMIERSCGSNSFYARIYFKKFLSEHQN